MISNISKRYARAFFEIAEEEKKLEQYYNELRQFSSIIEIRQRFRRIFGQSRF